MDTYKRRLLMQAPFLSIFEPIQNGQCFSHAILKRKLRGTVRYWLIHYLSKVAIVYASFVSSNILLIPEDIYTF